MSKPPDNRYRRYDSAALSRGESISGWLGTMARHVLNIDIDARSTPRFHASIDIVELASLSIVEFKIPPILMRRANRHLQDGNDGFALSIATAGQFEGTQAGCDVALPTGAAVLMSSRQASDLACLLGGRFWGVKIPRRWFEVRGLLCPDDTPVRLASSAALKLLVRYADGILSCHRSGDSTDIEMFDGHLSDLVAAALLAPGNQSDGERDVARRARAAVIADAIASQAVNPDLSLALLARHLGMSERTIQTALARDDTCFSDVLRTRRLELARSLIVNGETQKVATAAYEAGFRDLSTFNRSFRKHFGVRPTDLIKRHT